ncbi:hypothetical protein K0M31_003606 [Melipona bicolor]|uniref:Uncharacterized protein n=1 Tax=Melipona bicolor TaxID=60889 RepID=A0AA40FZH8_9HYME|nr:hypothetical protein K0M31_003606 [Melipona bicolor]
MIKVFDAESGRLVQEDSTSGTFGMFEHRPGSDSKVSDLDGQPYTTLLYSNGPGYTQPRNILREASKDSIQVKEDEKREKKKKHGRIIS